MSKSIISPEVALGIVSGLFLVFVLGHNLYCLYALNQAVVNVTIETQANVDESTIDALVTVAVICFIGVHITIIGAAVAGMFSVLKSSLNIKNAAELARELKVDSTLPLVGQDLLTMQVIVDDITLMSRMREFSRALENIYTVVIDGHLSTDTRLRLVKSLGIVRAKMYWANQYYSSENEYSKLSQSFVVRIDEIINIIRP